MQAKLLLAMCYYGTAKYAEAMPLLESAVAADPQNLQLRTALAQSCLWSAHYDCTLEQYKQIVALSPESAQADMLAGEALDGLGDTPGAIREFETAAKGFPQEPNVHFGLGYLLFERHQYNAAAAEFEAELKIDPNHAQALSYLGDTLIKQNNFDAALPPLMKAVKLPDPPRIAFVDIGIVYTEQKRNADALSAFQRAIAMDPEEVDAHWRLARLYASTGRQKEAQAEFARVNELHHQKDEPLATKMAPLPK
jgi:tetratricopeptide (TPR) repeat protein